MADQELFDGEIKTVIEDDENLSFRKPDPSTAGSRVISWANFKAILNTLYVALTGNQIINGIKQFVSSPTVPDPTTDLQAVNLRTLNNKTFNFIDFNPQDPIPSYLIGRMFYDGPENTWTFFNDIPGISLQLGEELRARLTNDTGATLLDGKAVAVISAVGANLQVELLDTSQLDSSIRGFGLMTHTVINGNPGYAVRYGAVRGLDTSFCAQGAILYGDPDTPGDLTATRPKAPNYPVRIGICLISDASQGVIAVDTLAFNGSDTTVNIEGQINGIVTQTPNIAYDASSGDIIATVTNEAFPAKKLPLMIDGVRYLLDTITSPQTIIIPPGLSSVETQESILYIKLNAGVPELAVTTSTTISEPFAILSVQTVFNAARTDSDGKPLSYRRYNNAMDSLAEGVAGAFGLLNVIANWIRLRGASGWTSGQDATPTVDNSNIKLAMSAGVGGQLHRSNLPAFDGNSYLIYNDNTNAITYESSINLTDITETSAGVTLLANNVYYPIKLYYLLNSNGVGDEVIATRPSNFYTTADEAKSDALKYGTSLADPSTELNSYAIYTMVIGRTGGGGATIALIELQDNRKRTLKSDGGGGGAATAGGTDDQVRVSAADIINNYLTDKLTVSSKLSKSIQNPAGDESLKIDLGSLAEYDKTYYVKSTGNDGTAIPNDPSLPWALASVASVAAKAEKDANGTNVLVYIFSGGAIYDNEINQDGVPIFVEDQVVVWTDVASRSILSDRLLGNDIKCEVECPGLAAFVHTSPSQGPDQQSINFANAGANVSVKGLLIDSVQMWNDGYQSIKLENCEEIVGSNGLNRTNTDSFLDNCKFNYSLPIARFKEGFCNFVIRDGELILDNIYDREIYDKEGNLITTVDISATPTISERLIDAYSWRCPVVGTSGNGDVNINSVDYLMTFNTSEEQTVDDFVDTHEAALVATQDEVILKRWKEITLTGTSGTATITLAGTPYLVTFNVLGLDETAADFITTHESAINTAGYRVDQFGSILAFSKDTEAVFTLTIANVSGDLNGTISYQFYLRAIYENYIDVSYVQNAVDLVVTFVDYFTLTELEDRIAVQNLGENGYTGLIRQFHVTSGGAEGRGLNFTCENLIVRLLKKKTVGAKIIYTLNELDGRYGNSILRNLRVIDETGGSGDQGTSAFIWGKLDSLTTPAEIDLFSFENNCDNGPREISASGYSAPVIRSNDPSIEDDNKLDKVKAANQRVSSKVEFEDKISIGVATFLNSLDVAGGMAVGSGYAGLFTSPTDGAIFEGPISIGQTSNSSPLDVIGNGFFSGLVTASGGFIANFNKHINFKNGAITTARIGPDGNATMWGAKIFVTGAGFEIRDSSDNVIFNFDANSGNAGFGQTTPVAKVDIDQSNVSGAIPVLKLTQDDISEEMIKLDAAIGVGNPIEAKAAKALTGTHFVKWNIEGVGDVYLEVGTIA